jgi:GxxExxY protein
MDINSVTYKINGAIFEVNRNLGAGFMEKVYENALMIELSESGLKSEKQSPIKNELPRSRAARYQNEFLSY